MVQKRAEFSIRIIFCCFSAGIPIYRPIFIQQSQVRFQSSIPLSKHLSPEQPSIVSKAENKKCTDKIARTFCSLIFKYSEFYAQAVGSSGRKCPMKTPQNQTLSSLPPSIAKSSGSKVAFHNYVELKKKTTQNKEQRPRSRYIL